MRPPGCQDNSKSSPRGFRIDLRAILDQLLIDSGINFVAIWRHSGNYFQSKEQSIEHSGKQRSKQIITRTRADDNTDIGR